MDDAALEGLQAFIEKRAPGVRAGGRTMHSSNSTAEALPMIRTLLAALLLAAGASAGATMSPCQADCEKTYKYCVDRRASSERTCRAEYEKCRRTCAKKDGKPSPT
jgi:hypothetical protein